MNKYNDDDQVYNEKGLQIIYQNRNQAIHSDKQNNKLWKYEKDQMCKNSVNQLQRQSTTRLQTTDIVE